MSCFHPRKLLLPSFITTAIDFRVPRIYLHVEGIHNHWLFLSLGDLKVTENTSFFSRWGCLKSSATFLCWLTLVDSYIFIIHITDCSFLQVQIRLSDGFKDCSHWVIHKECNGISNLWKGPLWWYKELMKFSKEPNLQLGDKLQCSEIFDFKPKKQRLWELERERNTV